MEFIDTQQQTKNGRNVLIESFYLNRKMEALWLDYNDSIHFFVFIPAEVWQYRSTVINRQSIIVNTYLFYFPYFKKNPNAFPVLNSFFSSYYYCLYLSRMLRTSFSYHCVSDDSNTFHFALDHVASLWSQVLVTDLLSTNKRTGTNVYILLRIEEVWRTLQHRAAYQLEWHHRAVTCKTF